MGKKKKECDDSPEHSCRKHAGLPKSDDSSRNNNRVSLRSLRVGKRRITEVTRVASGASGEYRSFLLLFFFSPTKKANQTNPF